MKDFILAVTGGRHLEDREMVYKKLDQLKAIIDFSLLVHGGATGADQLASDWCRERGMTEVRYKADWDAYGKSAGPRRNQEMANAADGLVAFPGGRGTADMMRRCQARMLPIWEAV